MSNIENNNIEKESHPIDNTSNNSNFNSPFIDANENDTTSENENDKEEIPQSYDLEQQKENQDYDELSRYESNVEASRQLTRRSTGADKIMEAAKKITDPLPPMGGGRDYPPPLPDRADYLVSFDGPNDPIHPHNFPLNKKIFYSALFGLNALIISMGSAMFSAAGPIVGEIYHVGNAVTALGTSLFVFGFASGPVIWGPLCELFGRRLILICSSFGYVCFCFAVACSENIQSIMITRFFSGFVGSSALVAAPAAMADLFGVATRGRATAIFAMVLFGGPMLAPIISAFIVKNPNLNWRWTQYITGILAGLTFGLNVLFLEETHHPLILVNKAETLRRRTGNWGIAAPHEEVTLNFKEIVENNLARPVVLLFTDPTLFLITLYNAFIYGLLYLFLTAIPLIFQGNYHFAPGVAELPYLSMFIGIILGGFVCIFFEERFKKVMMKNNGIPIPEERLPAMMVGSFFFCGGLFWLGWSGSYPETVHWIVPTIGAAFIGLGLITIFLPCINYIIDCYIPTYQVASAMAANTLLRSAFGAAFPLFARQMFVNMKIKWATTLLGAFAAILIPVPFLFYKYGGAIRAWNVKRLTKNKA